MKSFKAFFLLAVLGSVAADSTFSQRICFTKLASTSIKSVPTTTNVKTLSFTVDSTTTVTPTAIVTPTSTQTKTNTQTTTSTVVVTATPVSQTVTVTSTPTTVTTSTATATSVATFTTTVVVSSATNMPSTTTVAEPAGFTPIDTQLMNLGVTPNSRRRRSRIWPGNERRAPSGPRKSAPQYPAKVTCDKAVEVVHFNAKSVTASKTATVTAAAPTQTVSTTITQTATSTSIPAGVTSTVTVSAATSTITTQITITTTSTTTSATTLTYPYAAPTPTSYGICNDSKNYVKSVSSGDTTYPIVAFAGEVGENQAYDEGVIRNLADAASCCNACQSVGTRSQTPTLSQYDPSQSLCYCVVANPQTSCTGFKLLLDNTNYLKGALSTFSAQTCGQVTGLTFTSEYFGS